MCFFLESFFCIFDIFLSFLYNEKEKKNDENTFYKVQKNKLKNLSYVNSMSYVNYMKDREVEIKRKIERFFKQIIV